MDILTQALAGAAAGAATQGQRAHFRAAAFAGAVAAMAVDLDYFIQSAGDPLLQVELHRQFSHSLVFIPVGALLVSLALYPFLKSRLPPRALGLAALAGYGSHWLLDLFTGYGVELLWPFHDERYELDLLSVIDPLFTLLLALPLAWSLWRRQRRGLLLLVLLAVSYLGLAALQQQRATTALLAHAQTRGDPAADIRVRPAFANILLWRGIYRADGAWHVAAVRPGLFARPQVYRGGTQPVFDPATSLPAVPAESRVGRDIRRLARLSDDYLVWQPGKQRLGDIRFSMVPDGLEPMWGLQFDPRQPERQPTWFVDRTLAPAQRQRFVRQLLNADPKPF